MNVIHMNRLNGIMDILVSFETIFQALQTGLSRLMIKSVKSKIPKFPEFSLHMNFKFGTWIRRMLAEFGIRYTPAGISLNEEWRLDNLSLNVNE